MNEKRDPRGDPVDLIFTGGGPGLSVWEWIFYVIGPALSVTFFVFEFVLLPAARGELRW